MNAKKSKKANLERLRFPLLLIGITFSGALVLSAFEWRSFDQGFVEPFGEGILPSHLEDETIFAPIPEKKPVVKKKQVQKPVIDVFEIVKNEKKIDAILFLPDLGEEEPFVEEIGGPIELVTEVGLFTLVEEMPTFPGGLEALFEFLEDEMIYPSMARDAGIQGKVYVNFIVGKDGTIRDIKLLRGIGAGCDEEVLRVIDLMPKWEPGKQRGIPVSVSYNMPVSFKLN